MHFLNATTFWKYLQTKISTSKIHFNLLTECSIFSYFIFFELLNLWSHIYYSNAYLSKLTLIISKCISIKTDLFKIIWFLYFSENFLTLKNHFNESWDYWKPNSTNRNRSFLTSKLTQERERERYFWSAFLFPNNFARKSW